METMAQVLNTLNQNPCTAFDPASFPNFSEEQMQAAQRAWHAAIYAAALAISFTQ